MEKGFIADPEEGTVKVTWPDIVRVVDQHPRLAAGKLEIDAARQGIRAASAIPNPSFDSTVGHSTAQVGDTTHLERTFALTMPLGWIVQRKAQVGAAASRVNVAAAEAESLRRDVLLQLRTLFWNLATEQARVASLEALEVQTGQLAQTVKKRLELGEVRPIEGTRIEIELEKVSSELEAARNLLKGRQAELAVWLGVPAAKKLVAVTDLDALPVAVDRETALAKAQATHPALAQARANANLLEADLLVEKKARIPSFSLKGYRNNTLDSRAYGVGFGIDVPLWNWNAGRIAQAQARLAAGRKQAEATGLEINASVVQAQSACLASVATATRYRDNVVPRSEKAATIMERTYQLGESGLLEVIDARRTLLDARRLYLSVLSQAQIECSRLSSLIGEESK